MRGGECQKGGEYTSIYLAPDHDLDISEPGLDDGAELRLVAHNLVVAVLDQLAGTVVPVSRQRREGLELVAPERHHILAAVGAAAGRLFMGVVLFYESGRAFSWGGIESGRNDDGELHCVLGGVLDVYVE